MPLMAAAGTSVERISGDSEKNSVAPLRSCESVSVSLPSWLEGKMLIFMRPPDASRMPSAASFRRMLSGCVTGRLLANL